MIEDTPSLHALIAGQNGDVVQAKITSPATKIFAVRVKQGQLVVADGMALPVIDGRTSTKLFHEFHPQKLRPLLDVPLTPRGALLDCLFVQGSPAYYHFLIHHFPRFLFLKFLASPQDVRVSTVHFAPKNLAASASRVCSSLAAGRPVRVQELSDGVYDVSNVTIPTIPPLESSVYFNRQIVRDVLDRGERMQASKKLFIRRNAATRRLINENEIEAWLSARGYAAVDPSVLAYEDQVRTFAGATHIVGVEGGAMTNIVYAPAGARILVLASPAVYGDDFFSSLAKLCEQQFETAYGEVLIPGSERTVDFEMPLDRLVSWVEGAD